MSKYRNWLVEGEEKVEITMLGDGGGALIRKVELDKPYVIMAAADIDIEDPHMGTPRPRVLQIFAGEILHCQMEEFTLSQVNAWKKNGVHYQYGFASAYTSIPFELVRCVKLEVFPT